jgi:hypothetical protein
MKKGSLVDQAPLQRRRRVLPHETLWSPGASKRHHERSGISPAGNAARPEEALLIRGPDGHALQLVEEEER